MPRHFQILCYFGIAVGCYGAAANIVFLLAANGDVRLFIYSFDPIILLDRMATVLFLVSPFLLLIGSWLYLRSSDRGRILLIVYGFALILANLSQGMVRLDSAGNLTHSLNIREEICFYIGELDHFTLMSLFPGFVLFWLLLDRWRIEKPGFEVAPRSMS